MSGLQDIDTRQGSDGIKYLDQVAEVHPIFDLLMWVSPLPQVCGDDASIVQICRTRLS